MRSLAHPFVRIASLVAAIGVAIVGCSKPPELEKQLETLSSWTATMRLAREEHGAGAITTTYATQLRDAALLALSESEQTIGQSAHTAVDSAYAATALDSLRTAIRQLGAETGS
jgi:hypothetical protein